MKPSFLPLLLVIMFVVACTPDAATHFETATSITAVNNLIPSGTPPVDPVLFDTPSPSSTLQPTLAPDEWRSLSVTPDGISSKMVEVYQRGLARGRQADRFSKFGDCQNVTSLFLGIFDGGRYELGTEYA